MRVSYSQSFSFNSGPILMCDTNYFTMNVAGIGTLVPPGQIGYSLTSLCIAITSNHPQTLQISLTSPQGTNLLLSAFNGAGGSNYTNCCFALGSNPSITTGTAPFSGTWMPQGGSLSIFDYENADGIWKITIVDTACFGGTGSGGGPFVNGWFDGSGGTGTGAITFYPNNPCTLVLQSYSEIICPGDSVDITSYYNSLISSGYLFGVTNASGNWVNNPSAVSVPGNYQVQVADAQFLCTYSASFQITLAPNVNVGANQTVQLCATDPVDLNSYFNLTNITAQWSIGGVNLSSAAATSVTTSGTYQLIGLNSLGCGADTALLNLTLDPGVHFGPDQTITQCVSSPFNLTTLYNTTGMTTNWIFNGNNVSNPSAVILNGIYTLIASNSTGCSDTVKVTLNLSVGPNLGANQTVTICTGSSANLAALYSPGNTTHSWSFGGNSIPSPVAVSTPGVYTLIATTINGCTDTVNVSLNSIATPALGSNLSIANCSNQTTDLTVLFNTSGLTTNWLFNGSTVSNPTAVNMPGQYTLIASAGTGCSDTAHVVLSHLNTPALGPDQITGICSGSAANLTTLFNTTGFATTWTYMGNPVANPSSVTATGVYQLITVDAVTGCSDTALTTVSLGSQPLLGPNQQVTICDGETFNLTTLYSVSGLSVAWTFAGQPVINPVVVSNAGNYTITATNSAGCSTTAIVTLSLQNKPNLGNDQTNTICSGTTVDLTLLYNTTGLTENWFINNGVVSTPSAISLPGLYQLIASDTFGCSDTAEVNVIVNTSPDLGPDQFVTLCPDSTIDLSTVFNVAGYATTYSYNNMPLANITSVHDSGAYTIMVTDTNGCTDVATVNIANSLCLCIADFRYNGACADGVMQFEIVADSAIIGAHWTFANQVFPDNYEISPVLFTNAATTLSVVLEASLSCGIATVEKEISIVDCSDSCRFYLPGAFTPNGDGKNDLYIWNSECIPDEYQIEIYNRYGQQIFQTTNPLEPWSGTFQNTDSPEDIYVYKIRYRMPFQKAQVLTGTVFLLR